MKVWEVIAELAKCPAGADVIISRGEGTHFCDVSRVDTESTDGAWIVGDGSESDDDDVPN